MRLRYNPYELLAKDGLKKLRKLDYRLCFFYGTLTSLGAHAVQAFLAKYGGKAIYVCDGELPTYALRIVKGVSRKGKKVTPTCTIATHPRSRDIAHAKGQLYLVPEKFLPKLDELEGGNFGVPFVAEEVYVECFLKEGDAEEYAGGYVTAYVASFEPAYNAAPNALTTHKCLGDFIPGGSWPEHLQQQ
jgi:gamma-glutamylcyclotransferase (GGCT)/AIG2-like uncharacterized protein YtfP